MNHRGLTLRAVTIRIEFSPRAATCSCGSESHWIVLSMSRRGWTAVTTPKCDLPTTNPSHNPAIVAIQQIQRCPTNKVLAGRTFVFAVYSTLKLSAAHKISSATYFTSNSRSQGTRGNSSVAIVSTNRYSRIIPLPTSSSPRRSSRPTAASVNTSETNCSFGPLWVTWQKLQQSILRRGFWSWGRTCWNPAKGIVQSREKSIFRRWL